MGQIFRGGIPYAVDVKRLNDTFPVPSLTEGRIINHSQLEAIVTAPKGSQRYYGVINSWISQMKTANGIYMVWRSAVGIEILDPANLLTHAETKTRQKIRQTGKAASIYGWVDRTRLDSLGQQRFDHDRRVLAALGDAMQSAKKDLAVALAPIQSLPKPKLIREAKSDEKRQNRTGGQDAAADARG